MALSKTIAKHVPLAGEILVDSYCKVVAIRGGKDMVMADMEARQASSGELVEVWKVQFVPDLDGPNFIAQAYGHFKALPELSGCMDC